MPTLYIDNKAYAIKPGATTLLDACLSLGFNIPYFCWHPAMHSVGACRQCAVKVFKDEADTRGRIVMSCMTPAADGTRLSIDDPEAAAFRAGVVEWLMASHPHDCPVCDEGGECHLQDMTVMTGHTYRRFRFRKRTHANQDLGPFVNHEMNRCIQCYRCVRFYNDYAGGRDFAVLGWHDHVYFGRSTPGRLESEFSGNLVEVCPTGVFTDKTLKEHYTRPWDLQTAPSVCVHCGLGCNTIPGERYGTLRRIRARFHGEVNGYFLCDRGRYGYEFVNSDRRIRRSLVRDGAGRLVPATAEEAMARAAQILAGDKRGNAPAQTGAILASGRVIGIGSPRATLETNFALRTLVGQDRFYSGMSPREGRLVAAMLAALRDGPARTPSMSDVTASDAVLILGEDVTSTAPMLALALRQASLRQPTADAARQGIPPWHDAAVREHIQQDRGPFFVATPDATKLDAWATATLRGTPDELAALGFAVARAIDPAAPAPGARAAPFAVTLQDLARRIADALKSAERPVIISGAGCGSEAVIRAAANVAWALARTGKPAHLCFTVPEANSLGVAMMAGSASLADKPPVAPGRAEACGKDKPPVAPGGADALRSLDAAVEAVKSGDADTLIVAENDLFRRMDPAAAEALLAGAKHVIALDHLATPTTDRAEVVLPAATFAEATGTLVSSEGRAQRSFEVFAAEGDIRAGWRWLGELAIAAGAAGGAVGSAVGGAVGDAPDAAGSAVANPWPNVDALLVAMAEAMPVFREVPGIAPPAGFRMIDGKVPRQPHRASGRTAVTANLDVHEPQPPDDSDAPMAFSMEGSAGQPPAALIPRYWSPGWNSVQAINKFQIEVGGPLHGGDPGRRLIEPRAAADAPYYSAAAGSASGASDTAGMSAAAGASTAATGPASGDGDLLIVPAWHIFGSEELSVHAPGIAGLVPQPYVAVGPADAARLGASDGAPVVLRLVGAAGQSVADGTSPAASAAGSGEHRLVLRIHPELPAGVAAVAVGLPGAPAMDLPARGTLELAPAGSPGGGA